MMTHEDIHADLALLALGTLDPSEQRDFEEHVATCADCQRDLIAWREVVDALPLDTDDIAPPDLKPRLLARVRRGDGRAAVVPLRRSWRVPLALAAGALLVFGVVREIENSGALQEQRARIAGLQQELAAAHGDLDQVKQVLAERERDVSSLRAALASTQESLAILQAPGLQLVHLAQTPDAKPAEGHALLNAASGRALFYAFDLPAVSPEQTYELWWITEKAGPVNAGLFRPDDRGLGRVDTPLPTDAGAIQAAAVTVEPAGGVPKPTGPMVLLGKRVAS